VLAFITIVPIALEHCCCASFVESGVVGLSILCILMLMCIGLRSELLAMYG
jgi:hypothetical protein